MAVLTVVTIERLSLHHRCFRSSLPVRKGQAGCGDHDSDSDGPGGGRGPGVPGVQVDVASASVDGGLTVSLRRPRPGAGRAGPGLRWHDPCSRGGRHAT
eukprot:2765393-Rhodomonas_salina.3